MNALDHVAVELTALVNNLTENTPPVDKGLEKLADSAARHVPGAQYAGITMVERNGTVQTMAATHHYPRDLDAVQQQYRQGPCLSAAWKNDIFVLDDVAIETRWPSFVDHIAASTPIRSILSVAVPINQTAVAALNFHAEAPHAFGAAAREMGSLFAANTAIAWTTLRRGDQFRSALASRDIIGQAKGMIMERYRIDAEQAFALLTRLSKSSNTKIFDIAVRLIESERLSLNPTRPADGLAQAD